MDEIEEEGVYSDDDLDALPDHALSELEFNAVQSTQQKNQSVTRGQRQHDQQTLPILSKPPVQTLPIQPRYDGRKAQQYAQSVDYPQQPSSDYGNIDDEDFGPDLLDAEGITNLADPAQTQFADRTGGENTQREQWIQNRYSAAIGRQPATLNNQPIGRPVLAGAEVDQGVDNNAEDEEDDEEMLDHPEVLVRSMSMNGDGGQQDNAVDALQARIEEA
ncbi:hypothetical protein MMC16_004951 [Acarospora aff. strigata]|nr:hypothetical protein [Acarospora aff. strigata]